MPIDHADLVGFLQTALQRYRKQQIKKLHELKTRDLLRRKNPYLFRFKRCRYPQDLAIAWVEAYLSSSEETKFGHFLEEVAIWICGQAFGGRKSATGGIDLEFERDGCLYLVAIKSGPNWGNADQKAKMRQNFKTAQIRLRQDRSMHQRPIQAVNGCCYGRTHQEDQGDYLKLCGQRFWELISGDPDMYMHVLAVLGEAADEVNGVIDQERCEITNRIAEEIARDFTTSDDRLDWLRLLQFVSASQ